MTEYHLVLTVQWPNPDGGWQALTFDGTARPGPGATRRDLFADTVRIVHEHAGRDLEANRSQMNVLFWSCEPNELP